MIVLYTFSMRPFQLDASTLPGEVGTASVLGIGRKQTTIGGKDLIREKSEPFDVLRKSMKGLVVEDVRPDAVSGW